MPEIDYFINAHEVCKQVGLSRISIYRRMSEGKFPQGRKLSGNVVRWRQSEITAWMAEQPFNDVAQKAGTSDAEQAEGFQAKRQHKEGLHRRSV